MSEIDIKQIEAVRHTKQQRLENKHQAEERAKRAMLKLKEKDDN